VRNGQVESGLTQRLPELNSRRPLHTAALLRATPATLTGVRGRPMTASAVETKLCTPGISNRSPISKQMVQMMIASKPTLMRFSMITLLPFARKERECH
jgi:hypothetical protein